MFVSVPTRTRASPRWATPLLMVSVLGLVVQDIGFAIAAQAAVIPMAGLVMQGVVLLIAIGLATWGVGLIIIGPLLGHASWHAYRGAVRWQEPPAAPAPATVA